ncbi:hypothetical protein SAMN04488018_10357 [Myroides marinus]|uniref:PQQ-like domain-containing protein n=1 Tax=Myroides marinus TaxID=703342 RepID=A0A1H6SL72_9FLAO|nr:hypothetical protein [Myroides marinus]SEI68663.1 hypothetical protein SAMN04488018_10357 [Myroides marinus]
MFKKIKSFEKVSFYKLRGNDCIIKYSDNSLYVNNFKVFENVGNQYLIMNDNILVFLNKQYTKQYLFDLGNKSLKSIDNFLAIGKDVIDGNKCLTKKMSNDFLSWQLVSYDIKEDVIVEEYSIRDTLYTYYFDSKIIYQEGEDLVLRSLLGEYLWKFPLSELGVDPYEPQKVDSIKDILGVVSNNFWIYTRAGRLICLDLNTGVIKRKISGNPLDSIVEYHNTQGLGRCYLDEKTGNIVSISSICFQMINGETCTLESSCNYLDEDLLGIGKYKSIYAPLHQGDYFTFIAEKENDYGGSRYIGVFDYVKRKLVWDYEVFTQEEINQTRNKLVPPQKLYITEDGRKMYIKDFHDTLHVFERE